MKSKWEHKTLGDICVSELGKTLNQSKDTGTLRPYLCAINIQWDCLNLQDLKKARFEDDELERYSVQKGDLLVCEGGDVGRAALWESDEPMLYQNALHRIRFSVGCYPRFYLFCLRHLKNKGVLDSRFAKGVTIKHLVKSSLLSIPVPVPPLDEQQRIVAELDLLTEVIDKRKMQLKELDTLAQSIFYDMFGGFDENRKGFDVKSLNEVFSLITDGTHQTPVYTDDKEHGYKFLSAKDVTTGKIEWSNVKYIPSSLHKELSRRLAPQRGDILLCKNGTTGICALVETDEVFDIYVSLALLRTEDSYNKTFLVYAINNPSTKRQFDDSLKGVGVPNLHLGEIKKTKIIVPPLTLQQEFADKIQSIEKQKAAVNQSIVETQKLLDYTMDKYFG